MDGGTAGIPQQAGAPAQAITAPRDDAPDEVAPAQYVVEGSRGSAPGYNIQYGGSIVLLRTGKVVDQSTYDIEFLRSQGVRLRELPRPAKG